MLRSMPSKTLAIHICCCTHCFERTPQLPLNGPQHAPCLLSTANQSFVHLHPFKPPRSGLRRKAQAQQANAAALSSALCTESDDDDQAFLDPCYLDGEDDETSLECGDRVVTGATQAWEHQAEAAPEFLPNRAPNAPAEGHGSKFAPGVELPSTAQTNLECTETFSCNTLQREEPSLTSGPVGPGEELFLPDSRPKLSPPSSATNGAAEEPPVAADSGASSVALAGQSLPSAAVSVEDSPPPGVGRREAAAAAVASSAYLVMASPAGAKFLGKPETVAPAGSSGAADGKAAEKPGGSPFAAAGLAKAARSIPGRADSGAAATAMVHWDDWAEARDVREMRLRPDVAEEWANRGLEGGKVPFLRSGDGKALVTPREMRGVAEIVIARHFRGRVDPRVVCAIAEVESSRQPLAYRFEPARGEASTGLMQVLQSTAEWLARDMGYRAYSADWRVTGLYRPFEAVYFGAAYLNWLSTYQNRPREEEFIVRGYNGGPQGYALAATERYWEKYKRAKQALPWTLAAALEPRGSGAASPPRTSQGGWEYWDAYASPEDVRELGADPSVAREWRAAGDAGGRARFSRDERLRPFLTRAELRAAAGIVVRRHFERQVDEAVLCAVAEAGSGRLLHGAGGYDGLVPIDFGAAQRLSREKGFRAYRIESRRDMQHPFTALYFSAAYMSLLSQYGGQKRGEEFVVKALVGGPDGTETRPARAFWDKYQEARSHYQSQKKGGPSCVLL